MIRAILLSLLSILVSGCASSFTDRESLKADVSHRITGNSLTIDASIRNESSETITFVRHPDFYSIAVLAANRKDDEAFNFPLITYVRATKDDLVVVQPGESITFSEEYRIRQRGNNVFDISEHPQFMEPHSYMRTRGKRLQATFHYGKYPDYLPENAWALGSNYVMLDIGAREMFQLP